MWKYVITGNKHKALAVHSNMDYLRFRDYVREHSVKLHDDSFDVVFKWGAIDFVNPKVMLKDDFMNYGAAIIDEWSEVKID